MKRVILIRSNPVLPDPPVEKMADVLLEMGYAVTILAWDRAGNTDAVATRGQHCDVVRLGAQAAYSAGVKSFAALLRFEWKLWTWLRRNRTGYDIVHAFDLDTGFVACVAAARWKKRFVYHILDFYAHCHCSDGWVGKLVAWVERAVLDRADSVIICTEKRREQLGKCKQTQIQVIHNTPPECVSDAESIALQGTGQCSRIAYVGTLLEGRGIVQMLDAVQADARFELHIGGFGPLAERVAQAASRENSRVFWYGRLPYDQTLSLERQCDIMLALYDPAIPNHRYAAPNKLYEAMMLGKPVLTCASIGWDEEIGGQDTGVLIDLRADDGIKNGLDELYRRREQWERMGENGRARYTQQYSWQMMKERIRGIYSCLE